MPQNPYMCVSFFHWPFVTAEVNSNIGAELNTMFSRLWFQIPERTPTYPWSIPKTSPFTPQIKGFPEINCYLGV